jgi:hypothetical protein
MYLPASLLNSRLASLIIQQGPTTLYLSCLGLHPRTALGHPDHSNNGTLHSVSTPVANGPREASSTTNQSRIPSVLSTSFRKASDSTKNAVISRDNRKCWLCSVELASVLEVAHNVSASISLEKVCSSFLFISLVLDLSC